MDRVRNLEIFAAVADLGSLSGAGRKLGLSAPAVTRAIAALEEHVGARLLTRTTRSVTPTEAGARLLNRTREILALVHQAEREAAGEAERPQGRLTVTASVTFGRMHVSALLLDFLRENPEVTASLLLVDRIVNLVEEAVDVAFRIGELPDSSLVARRVGAVRPVLVASPAYLDARGRPEHPRALADHEFLAITAIMPTPEWRYREGGEARRVPLRPRYEVNDAAAALVGALRGDGITSALSYMVVDELREGRLELVLEPYLPPPVPVHLVTPSTRLVAARVRAFLDFAALRLGPVLAEAGASGAAQARTISGGMRPILPAL